MNDLERFRIQLQINGVSRTSPRDAIYRIIAQYGPIEPVDIVKKLSGVVHRATIYRAISTFLEFEIVIIIGRNELELSDRFLQHHHYRKCRACGKRDRFWNEALEKAAHALEKSKAFSPENHRIEISGLCRYCHDNSSTTHRPAIGQNLRRPPQQFR